MIYFNWRGFFGLSSKYIGIIYEENTKEIRIIFNPAYDYQLDDLSHIQSKEENRKLLKLPRGKLPKIMTPFYIPKIVEMANEILRK